MSAKFDRDRAKSIARALYSKYDIYNTNLLQPKQCYEVFSDFCYRILNLPDTPTMEQSASMHEVLDYNRDRKVTIEDFENLAIKYLCSSSSNTRNNYQSSSQRFPPSSDSKRSSTTNVTSKVMRKERTNLTKMAQSRLDFVRRLFEKFDKDRSGYLTEDEIPFILRETYKEIGQSFQPTKADVKSYIKMVDANNDGKISLEEFEDITLISLEKAGIQIYNNSMH